MERSACRGLAHNLLAARRRLPYPPRFSKGVYRGPQSVLVVTANDLRPTVQIPGAPQVIVRRSLDG